MATSSLAESAASAEMSPPPQFRELYERYSDVVYLTALRITGNSADAEDVLQTVFLRIWKQQSGLEALRSSDAYFRRAATNAAIDVLRRRFWQAETPLDDVIPRLQSESPEVLKNQIREALGRLEPQDAELFVLKYVEGLSGEELAEMYGIQRATVGSRLFRIRQTLRDAMEA